MTEYDFFNDTNERIIKHREYKKRTVEFKKKLEPHALLSVVNEKA